MHSSSPFQKIAVAGIGGFAGSHHAALAELEMEIPVKVAAACDPRERELGEWKERHRFAQRGVAIFQSFPDMLESGGYDWISLAVPIDLHAPMHAACVERGLPCYLEKPPTLDPIELEQMIRVDAGARRTTQVGFNYVYEPERLELKKRILAGEFGALRQVSARGAWRRDRSYYERNNWAGRLLLRDKPVLDSCLGNAMAHHVHNVLFFAGSDGLDSWGECREVQAQLYRANPIEGADTVFLRGRFDAAVEIRLALTHACEATYQTEEKLVCEKAAIRLRPPGEITIEWVSGEKEVVRIAPANRLKENLRHFSDYVGGAPLQLLSTLPHCRPFVHLNALAYLSTGRIIPAAPSLAEFVSEGNYWKIAGIEALLERFVDTGDFSILEPLGLPVSERVRAELADWNELPSRVKALRPS